MRRQNLFNDNQNCRCNDNSSDNSRRANDCTVINEHNCGCTICSQGPMGPAGSVLGYADFYALMPPDNAATVAPGTDVSFLQDGPNSGTGIYCNH